MVEHAVAEPWHHAMESTFAGLQVLPLAASTQPATGAFTSTDLGEVGVFEISGTPQQLVRSAHTARRSATDSVKVCAVRRGGCLIEQSGREVAVRPGHFVMYDTAQPYRITWQGIWECDVMTASLDALGVPRAALERARVRTWSATAGPGAVLMQYMSTFASMPMPRPATANHLASAGTSLLASVILEDVGLVNDGSAKVFRQQVESYVDRSLHRPELSLVTIAAAHHVSVRTLQRLFAGTARGLSGLIRQRRLEAIHRDLCDPRLASLTIAEVATRWCIHDAQWLAKAFKAEFGMAPSEFRRSLTTDPYPVNVETAL